MNTNKRLRLIEDGNAHLRQQLNVCGKKLASVSRRKSCAGIMGLLMFMGGEGAYALDCVPTNVKYPEWLHVVKSSTISWTVAKGNQIGTIFSQVSDPFLFTGCPLNSRTASLWARPVKVPVATWKGHGVYPTGVKGIGYALTGKEYGVGDEILMTQNPSSPGHKLWSAAFSQGFGLLTHVIFIATEDLSSGIYDIPRQVALTVRSRSYAATSIDGSPGATSNIIINPFRLTINAATCNLATSDTNRTIKLDPLKRADFVGQVAGKKNFEITANCSGASNVTFRFSGNPAPSDVWRFANTGTASGINLWLYSRIGGTEQTITANADSNARTVPVSAGRAVLPLGAGYYNTGGGAVKTGTLASTVTVNITYN